MYSTYFTSDRAIKRFFYIVGRTSDTFFSDGLAQLNIEQYVHMELKKAGYSRVVFLDKNNKLYTYDDESYSLNNAKGENMQKTISPSSLLRRNRGLGNGKAVPVQSNVHTVDSKNDNVKGDTESARDSNWISGKESGILVRNILSPQLHMGSSDDFMISRKLEVYMDDKSIKTAIVINDPASFMQDYGMTMHSFTTKYTRILGNDNENIIVFIYPDENEKNVFDLQRFEIEDSQKANVIRVEKPASGELKNMLLYLKYKKQLKFKISELDSISLALEQGMGLSECSIDEAYKKLESYAKEKKMLTVDECYKALGTKKPKSAEEQLNALIGMQSIKDALLEYKNDDTSAKDIISAPRLKPRNSANTANRKMINFIITGNKGTGKTTVASLIGQLFYEMGYLKDGHVVYTGRSELVDEHVGGTAKRTMEKVMEAQGGVLFIDEAYSLTRGHGNYQGSDFGIEAVDTLVQAMTDSELKGQFIVVAAGYEKEMEEFVNSNPGLNGRFSKILHIDDYTPDEMWKILQYQARKQGYIFDDELMAEMPNFCENWVDQADESWANGREAERLISEMDLRWKRDPDRKNEGDYKLFEKRQIPNDKVDYFRSVDEIRAEMIDSFNNMVGLNGVKDKLARMRRNIKFGKQTVPGHYLFVGNPGTGKTTVARYMGQIMRNFKLLKRGHLVEYRAQDLMSEFLKNGNDFNAIADKAIQGVLFIDEAYQLEGSDVGKRLMGALLPYALDHRKDMCIVLAGYEEEMDNLISQNSGLASRFTEKIYFDNYSGIELFKILLEVMNKKGIRYDKDYEENAKRILVRYIPEKSKEKSFSNARYVIDEFLPACEDIMYERVENKYGEDVDPISIILTGVDFPQRLMKYTVSRIKDVDSESAIERIRSMEGFSEIKQALEDLIARVETAKRENLPVLLDDIAFSWALKGNPGTGKTTIARMIGDVYKELGLLRKGNVVVAKRQDLVGQYVGETAIKTQKEIDKAMGGILFIDEAYTLTRSESKSDFGHEAVDTILEQMSSHVGEFGVIVAGYPDEMDDFINSNPGLKDRFAKIFVLEDYSEKQLTKIFVSMCKDKTFEVDKELEEVLPGLFGNMKKATSKGWSNARVAEKLLRDMQNEWVRNSSTLIDEEGNKIMLLKREHLPKAYEQFVFSPEKEPFDVKEVLAEINATVGFEQVKEKLSDFVSIVNAAREDNSPELMDDLSYHWVLKGNPGTGKTTIAKMVGKVYKKIGLLPSGHVIIAKRQDLVGQYIGETAIKTQKIIDKAMGGILFIDEAYTLSDNNSIQNDFGQEAIDTILEQMSSKNGKFGVIVAGYPDRMNRFISSNPGLQSRFDQEFILEDYTAEELASILNSKAQEGGFCLDKELKVLIPNLFENMMNARTRIWANGREAENLFRKMKTIWTRNRVYDDDKKTKILTKDHLPMEYTEYIKSSKVKKAKNSKGKKKDKLPEFTINKDLLTKSEGAFDYLKEKGEGFTKYRMGIAFIRVFSEDGESQGTGALITSDGCILTCEHVIHGGANIRVMLRNYSGQESTQDWYVAKAVWFDEKLDLAIIRIAKSDCISFPLSEDSLSLKGGEGVFMLSYPFGGRVNDTLEGLEASFFAGDIASKQVKNNTIRYLVGIEGKQGCSGAPVFAQDTGCIVGVFTGSQTVAGESFTEEVNYYRPISYIWDHVIKESDKK